MKKALFFLVICFLCCPLFSQQILKISAEVYKAFDELKVGYDDLNKVQTIVKEIEIGGHPDVASYGSDWSALANSFRKAANTIRNAPSVTDFDPSPYTLSIDELGNCYNKEQNFDKLRSYREALEDASKRGSEEIERFENQKLLIAKTREALKYLIDVNAKLISVPIYGEIFQWNWFDLEVGVRPALGDFSTAVNEQEKKLKIEISKINTQVSNLRSNIALLEESLCLIAGTYRGSFDDDGDIVKVTLVINRNGNFYNGTFIVTEDGENESTSLSLINITSNRFISFVIRYGDGDTDTFSGDLAPNYLEIRNFKVEGEAFSMILKK
jgi:hypothetical protein